jgi:hypothetical protein
MIRFLSLRVLTILLSILAYALFSYLTDMAYALLSVSINYSIRLRV